jgi:GGDEF domain-containing protein
MSVRDWERVSLWSFSPTAIQTALSKLQERILLRLSSQKMGLAGVELAVMIGIAAHEGVNADFSRMYRDAYAALYQARIEGKSNIGLFAQGTSPQRDRQAKFGTATTT